MARREDYDGRKLTRDRKTDRKFAKKREATNIKAHGLLSWIGTARARRAVPTPRCAHGSRWAAEGGGVIGRHGGPRRRRRRRPAQSARPPRAARGVAGQGAELRVVRKQRRVPRPERATTPITMRPTTMRLRPPAPGDAAKAERKAGVKRARAHARFGTAPLRVRVPARQACVGRLPRCPGEVSVTFRAPSRTAWTQSRRRAQARPPRTSSTAQRVVTARMDGPLDLRAK